MRVFPALTLTMIALSTSALAAESKVNAASQDYLTGYAGIYNVMDNGSSSAQFGVEYRFKEWDFGIRPTLGANADSRGAVYGYGGFNWEVPIGTSGFMITPNFMVGAYHEGGSRDLGGALEFRSGIELAYQLANAHRVGVAFNHISNASIYDKNPGAETLLLNYSVPVSTLFGK